MSDARALIAALLALAALYALWFWPDRHRLAALLVFALPPLLLALLAWRGWRRAGFAAGLLALLWFSHGVMVAWTRAGERLPALLAAALAVAIVLLASLPGLRARLQRR